jgi:hypothetical protein
MIQRIQTIFLLVCTIAYILLFFIPLKEVNDNMVHIPIKTLSAFNHTFSYTATFSIVSGFVFLGLGAAIAAIFSFKQRYLQIRLCYVLIFLALSSFALLHFTQSVEHFGSAEIKSWKAAGLFLSIALFALLASVYIKKDINLLKKANRIR